MSNKDSPNGLSAQGEGLGFAPSGERRQVTFVFADLVNSTQLMEHVDPEDLLDIMADYEKAMTAAVERFEGHVAHFDGDGMLAFFGYPVANEDAAIDAVHAARAVIGAVCRIDAQMGRAKGITLAVRAAVATGVVVTAPLTGKVRVEETSFIGSAPNLAMRLQQLADPNQVVASTSTRQIVGDAFTWLDAGLHALKGFDHPVRLYRVVGEGAATNRLERRLGRIFTPMVNRDEELSTLVECWERAKAGKTQVVLVSGDPGIGKSRLLQTFGEHLAEAPHLCFALQCSSLLSNTALYPCIELMQRMAGFGVDDDPATRLEKLLLLLRRQGPVEPEILALLAALLSIPADDLLPRLEMSPLIQRQRTLTALVYLLVRSARRLPVLVIYEDLHWLDPTSSELLEQVVRDVRDARLLVLSTTRPGAKLPWASEAHVTALPLPRLNAEHSEEMVWGALAQQDALPNGALEHIVASGDGVPLFIEELTHMVVERQSTKLPETLLDLLTARLDHLGPARLVAQIGAVIGREFPIDLAAAAADTTAESLRGQIERLLDSGLVQPTGSQNVVQFKHALVQDAAYDSILFRDRRQLHSRIADTIISSFSEFSEGEPEMVARHLTRGGRGLEGARWWVLAAQQAIGRGAYQEAVAHFEQGLEALTQLPDDEARVRAELSLLAGLGPAQMVMKGPGHADFGRVQRRGFEATRRLPDRPAEFPITYGLALFHWGRAELSEADPLADHLMAIARAEATAEHVMAANNMTAVIRFHRGAFLEARRLLAQSTSIYDPDSHAGLYLHYMMDFGVFGRFYLGLSSFVCGDPVAARACAREAVDLAARLNQPHSRGFAMLANFIVAAFRRDDATALAWADQCITFAGEQGFPEFIALAMIVRGWALAEDGDVETGLTTLEEGYARWKATGFENWQSWFGVLRADLLLALGRVKEAQAEMDEQERRIAFSGERCFQSLLTSARARALAAARCSELDLIDSLHRQAVSTAAAQLARSWELRCDLAYAAWLETVGRCADARTVLRSGLASFPEHIVTGDLRDARALLGRLEGSA